MLSEDEMHGLFEINTSLTAIEGAFINEYNHHLLKLGAEDLYNSIGATKGLSWINERCFKNGYLHLNSKLKSSEKIAVDGEQNSLRS